MVQVPLALSSYDRDRARDYEDALQNLMVERRGDRVTLLPRPGFQGLGVGVGAAVRAMFLRSGILPVEPGSAVENVIVVAGTTAFLWDEFAGATAVGTIAAGSPVSIEGTPTHRRICNGTTVYLSTGGNFAAEAMPSAGGYIWITTMGGHWFAVRKNSQTLDFLRAGETVWDALDFATAERRPDFLTAAVPLNDDVVLFGRDSLEVWPLTGEADPLIAPSSGQVFDRGCVHPSTIASGDNVLFYVGQDNKDNAVAYKLANGPERVSTLAVEEKLTDAALVGATGYTVNLNGHELYVLRLTGRPAMVYDATTDTWAEWVSAGSTTLHQTHAVTAANRQALFGDGTGRISGGRYDQAIDFGAAFETKATGFLDIAEAARCNRVKLETSLNPSGSASSVLLRTSDDLGATWINHGTRLVGQQGATDNRTDWRRGGLMRGPGRAFELTCTSATPVAYRELDVT